MSNLLTTQPPELKKLLGKIFRKKLPLNFLSTRCKLNVMVRFIHNSKVVYSSEHVPLIKIQRNAFRKVTYFTNAPLGDLLIALHNQHQCIMLNFSL